MKRTLHVNFDINASFVAEYSLCIEILKGRGSDISHWPTVNGFISLPVARKMALLSALRQYIRSPFHRDRSQPRGFLRAIFRSLGSLREDG